MIIDISRKNLEGVFDINPPPPPIKPVPDTKGV